MKLKNLYEHFDVISEESRQDIKVNYSININVDEGKFRAKGNGDLRIDKETAKNILSVEDVVNYIIQKEVSANNSKMINRSGVNSKDILSQMLFAFMDKENAKYLGTKDEIQFSFDYGPSENNCIGLLVTKPLGSPSFSIIMRLDKKALPNEFNKPAIDSQILSFSSMGDTN